MNYYVSNPTFIIKESKAHHTRLCWMMHFIQLTNIFCMKLKIWKKITDSSVMKEQYFWAVAELERDWLWRNFSAFLNHKKWSFDSRGWGFVSPNGLCISSPHSVGRDAQGVLDQPLPMGQRAWQEGVWQSVEQCKKAKITWVICCEICWLSNACVGASGMGNKLQRDQWGVVGCLVVVAMRLLVSPAGAALL